MSEKPRSSRIVIQGVTDKGQKFRPSDWAERLSGSLATFKKNRILYSNLLQPTVNAEGYKCVVLDPKLKESNLALYESILEFARTNQLNICDEEKTPEELLTELTSNHQQPEDSSS